MRNCVLITLGIFVLLQICHNEAVTGKYTVIAPGTIHGERDYRVDVGVYDVSEPCEFKIGITGPSYNEIKTIKLNQNEIQHLVFNVPHLEKGTYNLTAEGIDGLIFKNTTQLNSENPTPHAQIQTDKGKYKPGDTLNYRIIIVDENLRPAKTDDAIIWFEDPKRNRVKEIVKPEFKHGVYTGKFEFSEYALLGGWTLSYKNKDLWPTVTYFEVEKYVLPKFTAIVDATPQVSVKDGDIQIVVRSNYTFGEPVNGKATVIIDFGDIYIPAEETEYEKKNPPVLIKSTDMVNGKAKFDMNLKEYSEYMYKEDTVRYLQITATVEEVFTGIKMNATTGSTLYGYRYAMHCSLYSQCWHFESDKENNLLFRITMVDQKTPVSDIKAPVQLTITEGLQKYRRWGPMGEIITDEPAPKIENHQFTFDAHLNETGFVKFNVKLPDLEEFKDYEHFYKMQLKYLDEKRDVGKLYQFRKPKELEKPNEEDKKEKEKAKEPEKYFTLRTNYKENVYHYKMGEKASFTVNSSEPLSYLVFTIVGRGNIEHSERIELPDKPKVHNITYPTSFSTSPSGQIYVYYIDEHGELHYDESRFSVELELQNEITIDAPEKVKPGEMVDLHIKTAPNSYVGLLAIDQSLLLLAGNNAITKDSFRYVPGRFDTRTPYVGGYSRYPGEWTGVVTLTNADYFYNWTSPGPLVYNSFRSTPVAYGGFSDSVSLKSGVARPEVAHSPQMMSQNEKSITVRKDFSEVWLFDDILNNATGEFVYSKKIPDTITSWVLTGFSLSPEKGIGVTDKQTDIVTFQPFFMVMRLPYSMKRGEVLNVPVLVFNYLDKDLDVDVHMDNLDDEYEFIEASNEVINEQRRTKTVRVPSYGAQGASFLIRPTVVGNIMLKITAVSPIAGDAILKSLKVVPEGNTMYANRAYFVNLNKMPERKEKFELILPEDVVPNSEHIEFTVIGDILGPIFKNLDNLLHIPSGCGEQTVSKMLPSILVLDYLKHTNKLTPSMESSIKYNLEKGYQNILHFQHDDGSFSSFGPAIINGTAINGSTWLTAYVVKAMHQIKDIVKVDDKVLENALKYLILHQAENGTFLERGSIFYSSQRDHLSLTATAVLALAENLKTFPKYRASLDSGVKFLKENLPKSKDLEYSAMTTYALQKADETITEDEIKKIKESAKSEDDRMWWTAEKETNIRPYHWWRWSYRSEIVPTSYYLLVLLNSKDESVDSVLPIVRWLVAQRNNYGGFSSSQDTVVGLMALMDFAKKAGYEPAKMEIEYTTMGDKSKTDKLYCTEDNSLLLQTAELPHKTKAVEFTAKGSGAALVQISYQYNVVDKDAKPNFMIETNIHKDTPSAKLEMDVCVQYTGKDEASNMAILEINLPSGYVADEESFDDIKKVQSVRQIEPKNSNTHLNVYFDSLHKDDKQCIPIEAYRSYPVALQKPNLIQLYDYYDTSKSVSAFYEIQTDMCDLCEGDEDCTKKCK